MKAGSEKRVIVLLCILGVALVGYGMRTGSNSLFLAGLVMVVAGYLLLRRKLKRGLTSPC